MTHESHGLNLVPRILERWAAPAPAGLGTGRQAALDGIKGVAILMVIALHAAVDWLNLDQRMGVAWWVALSLDCFSRSCVPWFVMVSGFLLLESAGRQPAGEFFRKRLVRILPPFLGWSLIYILWRRHEYGDATEWWRYAALLLNGEIFYHLWFIYLILGLYLAAPFLQTLLERSGLKNLAWYFAIWFCGSITLGWLGGRLGLHGQVPLGLFGGFLGYFVLGGWLRRVEFSPAFQRRCAGFFGAGSVLTLLGSAWLGMRKDGRLDELLLLYLAPNIVLISVAGFIALRGWDWQRLVGPGWLGWPGRALVWLGQMSFGLYLAHVLVLQIWERTGGRPRFDGMGGWLLVWWLGTAAGTAVVVAAGRRIPGLAWLFP